MSTLQHIPEVSYLQVEDMGAGFPAGFLERCPYRWMTTRPTLQDRIAIFEIELEARGFNVQQFDLHTLAATTENWVGRVIRDVLDEAQGLADDAGEPLATEHVQAASVALLADTEEIAQWRFRLMDTPESQAAPAETEAAFFL